MEIDIWTLYAQMLRSRLIEKAVQSLWEQGLISGEMHLGVGEEAIVAGVLAHVQEGDALALDHRGTPPLVMRGIDPSLLVQEFLGHPQGLCHGMGGHMHLFSPEYLIASSGIVGASAPAAVGFALANQLRRRGKVAIAFLGEGAMNQGMVLEAINLAVVWQLPAIFVCKDDQWAITTPSANTTVANLAERARGFGMPAIQVDGSDVEAVWFAAREAFTRARQGGGPTFLHASCSHLEGHFLGYILLRLARKPSLQMLSNSWPLLKSLFYSKGAPFRQRLQALFIILNLINQTQAEHSAMSRSDPLVRARLKLLSEPPRLEDLENGVRQEINQIFESALNTSSFDKGG